MLGERCAGPGIPGVTTGTRRAPGAEVRKLRMLAEAARSPQDARAAATSQREVSSSHPARHCCRRHRRRRARPSPAAQPGIALPLPAVGPSLAVSVRLSVRPTSLGARTRAVAPQSGTPLSEVKGRSSSRRQGGCSRSRRWSCRSPPAEGGCEAASSGLRRPERSDRLWRGG